MNEKTPVRIALRPNSLFTNNKFNLDKLFNEKLLQEKIFAEYLGAGHNRLVELPFIESFNINFKFDALSHNFTFTTKSIVLPFSTEIATIYFLDGEKWSKIAEGIIISVEITTDFSYIVTCATMGWFLERVYYSQNALDSYLTGTALSLTSEMVKERFQGYFEFVSKSDLAKIEIENIKLSPDENLGKNIVAVCAASSLFVNCNIGENKFQLVGISDYLEDFGEIKVGIDENAVFDFNVKYNCDRIAAEYVAIPDNERSLLDTVRITSSDSPFHTVKLLKSAKENLNDTIFRTYAADLSETLTVSFSLPTFKINGKLLKTASLVKLSAPEYCLSSRVFFIKEIGFSFSNGNFKTDVSLCCCLPQKK
ncbi:MAG: hypothetical protein FWF51_12475 [Chitinivibrionia bacterium]|nr:hypothetical protein [Chitinivibrionia bacterium]